MGAVLGRGRAGVRSTRRCGVCLTAVHGIVEGMILENLGVSDGGNRPCQSGNLD